MKEKKTKKSITISKPIIKSDKVVIQIKEHKPAEYIPIFFHKEMEKDNKRFFFK